MKFNQDFFQTMLISVALKHQWGWPAQLDFALKNAVKQPDNNQNKLERNRQSSVSSIKFTFQAVFLSLRSCQGRKEELVISSKQSDPIFFVVQSWLSPAAIHRIQLHWNLLTAWQLTKAINTNVMVDYQLKIIGQKAKILDWSQLTLSLLLYLLIECYVMKRLTVGF